MKLRDILKESEDRGLTNEVKKTLFRNRFYIQQISRING